MVEFEWLQFLEQFVYQALFPFSLPLILAVRGRAAAANMLFLPPDASRVTGVIFTYMLAVAFYIALAMAILNGSSGDPNVAAAIRYEAATVVIGSLFQRMIVATKYAFMPRGKYEAVMRRAASMEEMSDDQLITGWAGLNDRLLEHETRIAGDRLGIDAQQVTFVLTEAHLAQLQATLLGLQAAAASPPPALVVNPVAVHKTATGSPSMEAAAKVQVNSVRQASAAPGSAPYRVRTVASSRTMWSIRALDIVRAPFEGMLPSQKELDMAGAEADMRAALLRELSPQMIAPADANASMDASATRAYADALLDVGDAPDADERAGAPVRLATVSAFWLTKALIRRSNLTTRPMSNTISFVLLPLCIAETFIPIIVRAQAGVQVLGSTAVHAAFFITCTYCRFWFVFIILHYVRVSIVDYRRRCNSLRRLTKLSTRKCGSEGGSTRNMITDPALARTLRSKYVAHRGSVTDALLPLYSARNVIAWLTTRRLLFNFGQRYFVRMQMYTSQTLALTVGLAAGVLITLTLNGAGSSSTRVADLSFGFTGMMDLLMLSALMAVMLRYGALANAQVDEHAALMTAQELEVRQAGAAFEQAGDAHAAARAAQCAAILSNTRTALMHDNALSPLCILGVPATYAFVQTLCAAAVSAASVVGRLIVQLFS